MKRLLVVLAALCTAAALYAALPAVPQENTWVTDGVVYGMAAAGGKVYIGGEFTYVGPNTGSLAAIDAASGSLSTSFPRFDGMVYAIVPDGNGGWYVGGSFGRAGGLLRNNAAHVLADGTVDPSWAPNVDMPVSAFAVVGSTVYVGGGFHHIDDQPRDYLAALNAATGAVTGWNPSVNGDVTAFAVCGSTVVIGGWFSSIGGVTSNLAAYDTASNTFRAFGNGACNHGVYALAIDGNTLYAGGDFTTLGGTACNRLAAIDMGSGSISAIGSGVEASIGEEMVKSLVVSGGKLYVGGFFNTICGQTRAGLAALNLSDRSLTDWDPAAVGTNGGSTLPGASSIVVNDNTVFVGGNFKVIGGQIHNNLAALDATIGRATGWTVNTGAPVWCLASAGSTLYAGGDFLSAGGKMRSNIAAIDAATGRATDWDPQADMSVLSLAVKGGTVYAGGNFTTISGQRRYRIAALNADTGQPFDWAPVLGNTVAALLVRGDTLYAGGSFTTVGPYIASWNLTTGDLNTWPAAAPDNVVSGLAASGNTVYACGAFANVGSTERKFVASWDATSGGLTGWDPRPDSAVTGFAVNGSTVYACGLFSSFGGEGRMHLAAFNAETNALINWAPAINDGTPKVIALDGAMVYVGGQFSSVNNQPNHPAIAAIEAATGDVTDWSPGPSSMVSALACYGSSLYVGGTFEFVGDGTRKSFAGFGQYTPLSVSGVSPASGALAGGTTVTISGHSFLPGATVLIGDRPAAATCVNGTTLTAVVPAGASLGAKAVTVTNPDGDIATLAGGYTYATTPVTPGDNPGTGSGTLIDPATGGTAMITPPSGSITVTVPGGTFGRAVTLAVSTTTVPASYQSGILPSSIGFEITNNLGLQPSRLITIMAGYRNQDIPDLIERLLAIARWDNGRWVPIPSVVDTETHTITGWVAHLSTFAIVQLAPAPTLADVTAYPNPFDPKKGQCFFANLTADATVKLYTVAGELVRTLQPSSTGIIAWDGKNDGGSEVASGVYIAFIKSSSGDKKLKIAVQR